MPGWVAAAAAVAGALISANGATSAADTQAAAANNAAGLTANQANLNRQSEQPYINSGYGAQSQLNYLLGIGGQPGTAQGGNGGVAPNGYDPSSGWGAGPGGTMHKYLTNGGDGVSSPGMSANYTYGGKGSPGVPSYPNPNQPGQASQGTGVNAQSSQVSGLPVTNSSPAGGYGSLLSPFTADTFHKYSPAYQFQLQQGQQGVLNGSEGSTGALSGAAMKDLMDYNQGMANTSFNNAFNQYQTQQGNIYSRLADVANRGQNAAAGTGQTNAGLAASTAQSISNAGTAQAAGQVGSANAIAGGLSSLGGLYASYGGGGSAGSAFSGAAAPGSYAVG